MNRPSITNKEDLATYLKVLAEEAVRKAYQEELNEVDPVFGGGEEEEEEGGEEGEDIFGGGDEVGEPEAGGEEGGGDIFGGDEPEAGGEEPEAAPEEPMEEPPAEKQKVEIRPTPLSLELGQVTSDGLIATLNMIRAGRSLKEPEVASELRKYFEEQLNDAERLALATFLSGLRDITGGKPAQEATDPGDENVNIDATAEERGEQEHPEQRGQMQGQVRAAPARPPSRGREDTTAPIQVGPLAAGKREEFRDYIKTLLG